MNDFLFFFKCFATILCCNRKITPMRKFTYPISKQEHTGGEFANTGQRTLFEMIRLISPILSFVAINVYCNVYCLLQWVQNGASGMCLQELDNLPHYTFDLNVKKAF